MSLLLAGAALLLVVALVVAFEAMERSLTARWRKNLEASWEERRVLLECEQRRLAAALARRGDSLLTGKDYTPVGTKKVPVPRHALDNVTPIRLERKRK
jgi:hypothetical protein